MAGKKRHWESIYQTRKPAKVSWFKSHLEKSLELIQNAGIGAEDEIIDVGGGASTLVDDLLDRNFKHVAVLDISLQALNAAKKRLGPRSKRVQWIEGDITRVSLPKNQYALWHDRAVFHFLTEARDRQKYVEQIKRALKPGGHVILATFSLKGPLQCSGLDVVRYSPETLSRELGNEFQLIESFEEDHPTPFGTQQAFIYCRFLRGKKN